MSRIVACVVFGLSLASAAPSSAAVLYNNLAPTNQMAMASRPDTGVPFEIDAADDFTLASTSTINSASFTGLFVPRGGGSPSVAQIVIEIYRVFPKDSDVGRTGGSPTFATPEVPTRTNSPSDVAFASRDSAAADLSFTASTLAAQFTASNSVQAGGIHPIPGVTTGGNGSITGQEVRIDVTFATPFDLPADHYFFVPQVYLTDGDFYWLSASRPIAGVGTTPISPDLQAWIRDESLQPDWLRVGTDIVGGASPPTFNASFLLNGTALAVPEPSTLALTMAALALIAMNRRAMTRTPRRRRVGS